MQTEIEPSVAATEPSTTTDSPVPTASISATAPGQIRVIKRNGTVVPYDDGKISVAITKAFLAVEGGTAAASSRIHETVARLTEQVSATFKRRMPDPRELSMRSRGTPCMPKPFPKKRRKKGLLNNGEAGRCCTTRFEKTFTTAGATCLTTGAKDRVISSRARGTCLSCA